MTEIVVQTDLGGLQISFVEKVDGLADAELLNATLDRWGKAIGRQRSKVDLAKAVMDLLNAKRRVLAIPEERRAYAVERAHVRAKLRSSMEQQHLAGGRRTEFKPSVSQRQGLDTFDAETAAELKKLDAELENCEKLVPIFEAQRDRLMAVINGEDQIDTPLREAEAIKLPRAADAAD